ncbi:MAG: 3-isopropylmalate dehydratase small subunit [Deltaproteobacteria bacterium]|nr:3-isopropylmalate dehydratase small subunit [Deltaproteobacteria bacterium]
MKIEGRIWKFEDNIDTDLIIPARYLNVSDGTELAKSCFIDHRPDFTKMASEGDIIVAGKNFGCGSSREHAPLAIRSAGVGLVIAKSFARIFYRNAFNTGLPLLESDEAFDYLLDGDRASVNMVTGEINNLKGKIISAKPIPDFMRKLIDMGGLVNYIREVKLKELN